MLRIGQVEATATQDGKYTDGSVAGGIAALIWEKAQRYPLVCLFRGLQPHHQQVG